MYLWRGLKIENLNANLSQSGKRPFRNTYFTRAPIEVRYTHNAYLRTCRWVCKLIISIVNVQQKIQISGKPGTITIITFEK